MACDRGWIWCLLLLVLARAGYAGANLFYDALLVDITEATRRDWISSSGDAWGYIGSVVPFLAAIAVIFSATPPGEQSTIPPVPAKIAFVIVALWWLAFSVPLLRNVRQVHFIEPTPQPIRDAFSRLVRTLKEVRHHRSAFLFLVAYFFYIDGLGTITTMAGVYGREVGLEMTQLILALLMGQIVSFPFSNLGPLWALPQTPHAPAYSKEPA